jgi:hypothetical protein
MKKSILTISIMLTVALTTAFAKDDEGVSQKAKESFNSSFNTASSVNWQQEKDFVKATFTYNNQILCAFYDNEGTLLAITRNILSDQLPINLLADLKKNYSKLWITDLFELAAEGETSYYVTLENADEILVLKSGDFNSWHVYKRTKRA